MAQNAKRRAKRYAVIACDVHGRESDKWAGRMLPVAIPANKRQARSGCPACSAELRKSAVKVA